MTHNNVHAVDAAITVGLHILRRWRRVTDVHRWRRRMS